MSIYVIPPDAAMAIVNGLLRLMPRTPDTSVTPIDFFLAGAGAPGVARSA